MSTVVALYIGLGVFLTVCGVGFTIMAKSAGYDTAVAFEGTDDKKILYELVSVGIMFAVGCLCVTGALGTILGFCLGVRKRLSDAESG